MTKYSISAYGKEFHSAFRMELQCGLLKKEERWGGRGGNPPIPTGATIGERCFLVENSVMNH